MLASLRDGSWITGTRIRTYSLMLIAAYVLGAVMWFAMAKDGRDAQGQQYGADFSQVYAAGTFVRDGEPAKPYKMSTHFQRQRDLFGEKAAIYTWNYPPYFLVVAGLLAGLPYLVAFFLWQFATLPIYLASIRGVLTGPNVLLAAAAFPAVYVNFGHGQTGFIAAGLLAGGLVMLDRRPILSGVLFALLAFKPQYGLLIPLALAAGGRWKAVASAAATLAAMTLATLAAYGPDAWTAFRDSLPYSRMYGLEYSNTGYPKMQSLFAAVRMVGGPVPLAYALHGALLVAVTACVIGVWRSAADHRLKSAALMTGAMLATPYCFDYDMVMLGPAIACLVAYGLERGFLPWEKSLLALAFVAPIIARPIAMVTYLPFGLAAMLALFVLILRRAAVDDVSIRKSTRRLATA
jgi:alpha-1,2-mannosyltransferase